MNKYQEAVIELKEAINVGEDYNAYSCLGVLEELVDRATPQKVIMEIKVLNGRGERFYYYNNNGYKKWLPFNCRIDKFMFCPHTGQALDWSEEL